MWSNLSKGAKIAIIVAIIIVVATISIVAYNESQREEPKRVTLQDKLNRKLEIVVKK